MKYSAFLLAARAALIFLPLRKKAVPRRLPITRWETHYWTKMIDKEKGR
jgi:hypothetical protein